VARQLLSKVFDMNEFDAATIGLLNGLAHRWWLLDASAWLVAKQALFRTVPVIALLWWVWFVRDDRNARAREIVVATLAACVLAEVLGVLASALVPFRLRPIHEPALHFTLPFMMSPRTLEGWSSFPSDHAALFFTLCAGVFAVSRRLGLWACAYSLVVICLPRVYLGVHYPTDILAGAAIGIFSAWLMTRESVLTVVTAPAMRWLRGHPQSFYLCFMVFSYLMCTMFDDVRDIYRFGRMCISYFADTSAVVDMAAFSR
jgi:undecaprenyl-diphosphatase